MAVKIRDGVAKFHVLKFGAGAESFFEPQKHQITKDTKSERRRLDF